MGFTRSYRVDTTHPEFEAIWPQLVADARRIVEELSARGIAVRGGLGTGDPIVTTERAEDSMDGLSYVFERGAIWINGDADAEEDCETFVIAPGVHEPAEWFFTKTGRLPYDVAVAAILIRAKLLAPSAVEVPSADTSEPDDPSLNEGRALLASLELASDVS
jgi:hypothetical protein